VIVIGSFMFCWCLYNLMLVASAFIFFYGWDITGAPGSSMRKVSHKICSSRDFTDNVAERSYETNLCSGPIDIVYTWVNGSDPELLASIARYREEHLGEITRPPDNQTVEEPVAVLWAFTVFNLDHHKDPDVSSICNYIPDLFIDAGFSIFTVNNTNHSIKIDDFSILKVEDARPENRTDVDVTKVFVQIKLPNQQFADLAQAALHDILTNRDKYKTSLGKKSAFWQIPAETLQYGVDALNRTDTNTTDNEILQAASDELLFQLGPGVIPQEDLDSHRLVEDLAKYGSYSEDYMEWNRLLQDNENEWFDNALFSNGDVQQLDSDTNEKTEREVEPQRADENHFRLRLLEFPEDAILLDVDDVFVKANELEEVVQSVSETGTAEVVNATFDATINLTSSSERTETILNDTAEVNSNDSEAQDSTTYNGWWDLSYSNDWKLVSVDLNCSQAKWIDPEHVEIGSAGRYRDMNEMKYSLRSIEQFAPWIRKIFIVTNGQVPNWLNLNHPRIELITHDMIFANKSHLPVFASPAIESNLHRIPGLSEKFLYFNDDVMLGNEIWPDDFWLMSGSQRVYLSWDLPGCASGCPSNWLSDGYCDAACNNEECNWDEGDCDGTNPVSGGSTWGDGKGVNLDVDLTKYCASMCPLTWLGDKVCDRACQVKECGYDGGDCGFQDMKEGGVKGFTPKVLPSNNTNFGISLLHDDRAFYINFQSVLPLSASPEEETEESENWIISAEMDNPDFVSQAIVTQSERLLTVILFPASVYKEHEDCHPDVLVRVVARQAGEMKTMTFYVNQEEYDGHFEEVCMEILAEFSQSIANSTANRTEENDVSRQSADLSKLLKDDSARSWVFENIIFALKGRDLEMEDCFEFMDLELKKAWMDYSALATQKEAAGEIKNEQVMNNTDRVSLPHDENAGRRLLGKNNIYGASFDDDGPFTIVDGLKRSEGLMEPIIFRDQWTVEHHTAADNIQVMKEKELATLWKKDLELLERNYSDALEQKKLHPWPWVVRRKAIETLRERDSHLVINPSFLHPNRRRLLDMFGMSLRYVDTLFSKHFGREARKVPSHMPHAMRKSILQELHAMFPLEFEQTSSHRFRSQEDMQFSFSYFYFMMNMNDTLEDMAEFYGDVLDRDKDGYLDKHEEDRLVQMLLDNLSDEKNKTLWEEFYHSTMWNITTQLYEKYSLPFKISIYTVNYTMVVRTGLEEMVSSSKKYKHTLTDENGPVEFYMVPNDYDAVVTRLQSIRDKRPKFICLNDNLPKNREPDPRVLKELSDHFERYYPFPSHFELPQDQTNACSNLQECTAQKEELFIQMGGTNNIRTLLLMCVLIVLVMLGLTMASSLNDSVTINKSE